MTDALRLVPHRFTCPGEYGADPEGQMHWCPRCSQMALLRQLARQPATAHLTGDAAEVQTI